MSLTIPTTWHAGSHSLPPDLVSYFPRSIWLLISSFIDARHLIHTLSDDKILALWVKQIELQVIKTSDRVEMKSGEHLHNPFGGPAHIEIHSNRCRVEKWYENNQCHRIDGPARIQIYPNGRRVETWYKNNQIHRLDGPAITDIYFGYYAERWYQNGQRHRIGKPAYIETYSNGTRLEYWYENDVEIISS